MGVKCDLKTKDWTAYLDDARHHKLPAWMGGWTGDNGDPDNFLYYFFGTKPGPTVANNNTWENPQVRDLLLQAQRSVDDATRDQLYKQVATIVRSETPKIPMAHTTPPLFAQSYVQGYVTNPGHRALQHGDPGRQAVNKRLGHPRRGGIFRERKFRPRRSGDGAADR